MDLRCATAIVFCLTTSTAFAQGQKKATPAPETPSLQMKVLREIVVKTDLLSIAAIPGTEKIYAGGADGKIYLIDFKEAKLAPVSWNAHASYVSGVALAGKTLISCGWDRKLIWWDVEKREPFRTLDAHKSWIRKLVLSPDQSLVASISDDMTCKLWEVGSGKIVCELKGFEPRLPQFDYSNQLYTCAFSPDGKFLAASDQLCQVIVWEVAGGKEVARIDAKQFYKLDLTDNNFPRGGLRGLVFTPDGQSLALGGVLHTGEGAKSPLSIVQVYDWKAGKLSYELKGTSTAPNNHPFETLWIHPGSDWLLAFAGEVSQKALMAVFDLKEKRLVKDIPTAGPNFGLAVSEKMDVVYTVGRGKAVSWQLTR